MEQNIVKRVIEEEMKQSYLDYAMSVIVGRALPDVRDGLKPAHRRVLFAMHNMGLLHNKPFKKCARIVGEVLGKYHPHGDAAVYDTLVRMAQDFSLRYPLVMGQGNFGSIDGDNAAAMRYTEAKLAKIAEEMLLDIDKETVKFVPNFDSSLKEPEVLPAKLPNLLINGSSGIAVGMATNIPPHNVHEVCDAVIAMIKNPQITPDDLMRIVRGPDFPTAGIIIGRGGLTAAYKTGRGAVIVRALTEVEENKTRQSIIVKQIPYMVDKSLLIEQIAECIKTKSVEGISDLRDESDRDGIRIVLELKKDADSEVVLNQLYKHTRLQTTFGINMLALVNNRPQTLNLSQLIFHYLDYRKIVVTRRTQYDLKKAERKAHILEGLLVALKNIDAIIALIRGSKEVEEASAGLMGKFKLSEHQAKAILEMRLQRLTALEQQKILEEHAQLLITIKDLKAILASQQRVLDIIVAELSEMKQLYGDERRTSIVEGDADIVTQDLVPDDPMVITITNSGYIKRTDPGLYRQQRRGGKGVIAATTKEEDFVKTLFLASNHNYLLFFTNRGRVYWLKVYEVPESSRAAKGKAMVNLLRLTQDELVTACIPVKEFDEGHYLVAVTKKGTIKKTHLSEFSRPRSGGIIAINLDEGDMLEDVVLTDGNSNIMLATKSGLASLFSERDVRPMGRGTRGVRGIGLRGDDEVVGMVIAHQDKTLLSVTENGYGKRTPISEYRFIRRGGKGVINIQCSERNGKVVAVQSVEDEDEIMLISKEGILIRVPVKDISVIGRNTQGVRIMKLGESDQVMGAAKVME